MNTDELSVSSDIKKTTFIEHVFNFNDDTKSELLNILQYLVLCLVPVVMLNKVVAKVTPDVDEDKVSYEMLAEVLMQSALTLLGVFFIHRFITYFPTYSGKDYASFHVTNIAILFVVIVSSFQTRIGGKINILIDRAFDVMEGRTALRDDAKKIKDAVEEKRAATKHQPSRADVQHMQLPQNNMPTSGATDIQMLEHHIGESGSYNSPQNPNTDFNTMFAGPNNPMVNAQQPHSHVQEGFAEPMAANDFGSGLLNAF